MKKRRIIKTITSKQVQIKPTKVKGHIPVNTRAAKQYMGRYMPTLPSPKPTESSVISNLFIKYKDYTAPCIAITHLYFKDLIDETIIALKKIPYKCEFIFTLTDGSSNTPEIHKKLKEAFPKCIILPMKNSGKDIGPKLKAIKWLRENKPTNKYKYLLFLHDKKHGGGKLGAAWRTLLYNTLCSHRMFTSGFYALETEPKVKMVSAARWVIYGKMYGVMHGGDGGPANRQNLHNTCMKLGINFPEQYGFVGGTMFWCNFEHFNKCWTNNRLNIAINAMDKEIGNFKEPSFTHAIERIFGMLVTAETNNLIMKI